MFLDKIAKLGQEKENSYERNKKISIVNYSSFFGILVLGVHVLVNVIFCRFFISGITMITVSVFMFVLYFNSIKKYKLALIFLFFVFPVNLVMYAVIWGDTGGEHFLFSMVILSFFIFDNKKTKYFYSIFYLLIFITIRLLLKFELFYGFEPVLISQFYWFTIFASFIVLISISYVYSSENARHLNSVNKQYQYINKLSRELNHRVKNNMQLVSSLFNLQLNSSQNTEIISALSDARNRVLTIALLHKRLYQEDVSTLTISVKEFITDICNFLIQSASPIKVDVECDINDFEISIEQSVHIGLVINEVVTNSIKYAFKENTYNKLTIKYDQTEHTAKLYIKDNGEGFPKGLSLENSNNFGIFLVKALTEGNDGEIKFYNNNGAIVEAEIAINFK